MRTWLNLATNPSFMLLCIKGRLLQMPIPADVISRSSLAKHCLLRAAILSTSCFSDVYLSCAQGLSTGPRHSGCKPSGWHMGCLQHCTGPLATPGLQKLQTQLVQDAYRISELWWRSKCESERCFCVERGHMGCGGGIPYQYIPPRDIC